MQLTSLRTLLLLAAGVALPAYTPLRACDMHGMFGGWGGDAGHYVDAASREAANAERIAEIQKARQAFLSRFPGQEPPGESSPAPLPKIQIEKPTTASVQR